MRHNRVLDSQCFQRAASPARLGKGQANSQCQLKITRSDIPSALCLPVLSAPGALQPLASCRVVRGWQKGSPFLVGTYVIDSSSHVFPILCPSNFMLRQQVHKCITSRKMLWKRSLSFRVGLHWGAIRRAFYWSLFHNLPWDDCSSILFFLHPATGVVAKNCGVTCKYHFFSWFFPTPGVDEFVERWILDPYPQ